MGNEHNRDAQFELERARADFYMMKARMAKVKEYARKLYETADPIKQQLYLDAILRETEKAG